MSTSEKIKVVDGIWENIAKIKEGAWTQRARQFARSLEDSLLRNNGTPSINLDDFKSALNYWEEILLPSAPASI